MNELTVELTSTHYTRDCKYVCGHWDFWRMLIQKCSNLLICDIFTNIQIE